MMIMTMTARVELQDEKVIMHSGWQKFKLLVIIAIIIVYVSPVLSHISTTDSPD